MELPRIHETNTKRICQLFDETYQETLFQALSTDYHDRLYEVNISDDEPKKNLQNLCFDVLVESYRDHLPDLLLLLKKYVIEIEQSYLDVPEILQNSQNFPNLYKNFLSTQYLTKKKVKKMSSKIPSKILVKLLMVIFQETKMNSLNESFFPFWYFPTLILNDFIRKMKKSEFNPLKKISICIHNKETLIMITKILSNYIQNWRQNQIQYLDISPAYLSPMTLTYLARKTELHNNFSSRTIALYQERKLHLQKLMYFRNGLQSLVGIGLKNLQKKIDNCHLEIQEYKNKIGNVIDPRKIDENDFSLYSNDDNEIFKNNNNNFTDKTERKDGENVIGKIQVEREGYLPENIEIGKSERNLQSPTENNENLESSIENNGNLLSSIEIDENLPSTIETDGNLPSTIENDGNLPSTIENNGNLPSISENRENLEWSVENNGNLSSTIQNIGNLSSTIENNGNLSEKLKVGDGEISLKKNDVNKIMTKNPVAQIDEMLDETVNFRDDKLVEYLLASVHYLKTCIILSLKITSKDQLEDLKTLLNNQNRSNINFIIKQLSITNCSYDELYEVFRLMKHVNKFMESLSIHCCVTSTVFPILTLFLLDSFYLPITHKWSTKVFPNSTTFKNLTSLNLSRCNLNFNTETNRSIMKEVMKELKRLRCLDLSENRIDGSLVYILPRPFRVDGKKTNDHIKVLILRKCELNRNDIYGIGATFEPNINFEYFSKCVTNLPISATSCTNGINTGLEYLDLSENNLSKYQEMMSKDLLPKLIKRTSDLTTSITDFCTLTFLKEYDKSTSTFSDYLRKKDNLTAEDNNTIYESVMKIQKKIPAIGLRSLILDNVSFTDDQFLSFHLSLLRNCNSALTFLSCLGDFEVARNMAVGWIYNNIFQRGFRINNNLFLRLAIPRLGLSDLVFLDRYAVRPPFRLNQRHVVRNIEVRNHNPDNNNDHQIINDDNGNNELRNEEINNHLINDGNDVANDIRDDGQLPQNDNIAGDGNMIINEEIIMDNEGNDDLNDNLRNHINDGGEDDIMEFDDDVILDNQNVEPNGNDIINYQDDIRHDFMEDNGNNIINHQDDIRHDFMEENDNDIINHQDDIEHDNMEENDNDIEPDDNLNNRDIVVEDEINNNINNENVNENDNGNDNGNDNENISASSERQHPAKVFSVEEILTIVAMQFPQYVRLIFDENEKKEIKKTSKEI
ncbi:hypothetical protein SNEBB_004904 [Seison nebaliae]|nr:hypothetical protein SNEBB_004904 [Seison nebaliae]